MLRFFPESVKKAPSLSFRAKTRRKRDGRGESQSPPRLPREKTKYQTLTLLGILFPFLSRTVPPPTPPCRKS